ncbi:hypothetical protein K6U06_16720 [Acidiferrimicrobium sp. IK]|uniref:hypothetical protein n=1 Tax=Acidiferrimicrobium sp. IK TaxID=2871700 RepID=UPI0021CB2638|nr:hypothetical protein [Acidiferrimicrobium sp. IK]MCU4186015.1 hypothetical protein [Acidiferrimicrobium sp. IK]
MTPTTPRATSSSWPLERVLFAMAGSVTLLSAVLAATVSKWFLLLTAFVGINQWLYVSVRACPVSLVLKRTCGLRSSLYPAATATRSTLGGR